jgi:hypothetical protein
VVGKKRPQPSLSFHLDNCIKKIPQAVHVNIALENFNMGSKSPETHRQTPDGMTFASQANNEQF